MTRRIVRWDTGAVIWEGEADTVKDALHAAIAARANLTWANLSGANLSGANLSGANLTWANLTWANLSGANLSGANLSGANLSGANLTWANLTWANLSGANLSGANLSRANLSGANLSGANLSRANLSRANLSWANPSWANLSEAIGIQPVRCTPLLMLLDQPGPIRAYKLVNEQWEGPWNGGVKYAIGEVVSVAGANTVVSEHCGAGINVATLDWCLREWRTGYRILIVEFTADDIAAIPTATDGKFRLHRCTVIGEKDITEFTQTPEAKA